MNERIDWSHRAEYMFGKHSVTVEMANDAVSDPNCVVLSPDPASRSGVSDRTIGWSDTAAAVLVVITVEEDGVVYGINGWIANAAARRLYREGR